MSAWQDEIHEGNGGRGGKTRIGVLSSRTLFDEQSPFQRVRIFETEALGRVLMLDDLWMAADHEEATYHEMISHPALTTAKRIERVLVIGGGDGGTAREVLRHPGVTRVDMVEIDGMVVEACKTHMPQVGRAWDDPRLNVIIDDGVAHVQNAAPGSYDVILVDGSDPVGPAVGLFNDAFYEACGRALTDDGVFATQAESPTLMRDVHVQMWGALEKVFSVVRPYYATISLYPGASWSWLYASKGTDPLALRAERVATAEAESTYYNAQIHRGAFAVPNHVLRAR